MDIQETSLPGVIEVTPNRFGDNRGFFSETWNRKIWRDAGLDFYFVQDNHSKSASTGTLRGLHFQSPPAAQDKLVRVVSGAILDVAVDIRYGSPNFGKWVGVELTADNGKQLLVPKGFLHGFLTLTDNTEVVYKCTDFYAPDCDGAVRFDDATIGIDWGMEASKMILSDKDAVAPLLSELNNPFVYED